MRTFVLVDTKILNSNRQQNINFNKSYTLSHSCKCNVRESTALIPRSVYPPDETRIWSVDEFPAIRLPLLPSNIALVLPQQPHLVDK